MTHRSLAILALLALSALSAAPARASERGRWTIGLFAASASPRGELGEIVPDRRWGGGGYAARRMGNGPLRLGLDVGLLANGSADVTIEGASGPFGLDEGRLENGITFGHFLARVQPVLGRLAPYVEGVFGLRVYETAIVLDDCLGPCTIPDERTDTALSAGFGGGLSFRLNPEARNTVVAVDVAARYLAGGTADLFRPEDVPALAAGDAPVPARSRTNLFWVSFGIALEF